MSKLADALRDLDENAVYAQVEALVAENVSPMEIIGQCNEGIGEVGERFARGEYYLTELMFSAEIMQEVMKKLNLDETDAGNSVGTVVIGTVKDDIHDIGKNIVISLLRSNGFAVEDLGVDVPVEKFIAALQGSEAKVLGLSALLNNTYPEMKNVVDAVEQAGLRDRVRIIIGGTICSEQVREYTGADYYARDAVAGVKICKEIYGV